MITSEHEDHRTKATMIRPSRTDCVACRRGNRQSITLQSQQSHGSRRDSGTKCEHDGTSAAQDQVKQPYREDEDGDEDGDEDEAEKRTLARVIALEQELHHACERADFYRHERDYFRSLANQQPGKEALCPRPPSPQARPLTLHPHQYILPVQYDFLPSSRIGRELKRGLKTGPSQKHART